VVRQRAYASDVFSPRQLCGASPPELIARQGFALVMVGAEQLQVLPLRTDVSHRAELDSS
jgi:hypothetical protein